MKLKEQCKEIDNLVQQGYKYHYEYPEKGIKVLDRAIYKSKKINYDKGLIGALINKARCKLHLGRSRDVLKCCYDILKQHSYKTSGYQKCDIYNLLGVAHNYLNEPFLGLKCAYQGLRYANNLGSFSGASNCHNTIAHIYLNDKIYDKALEHLLECLASEKKTGIASVITRCNAASVLLETGKLNEAKKFLDEAMKLSQKSHIQDGVLTARYEKSLVHNLIAGYYYLKNDFEPAKKHIHQSLSYSDIVLAMGPVASGYYLLGVIYMKQNDLPEALKYLLKSIEIRDEGSAYLHEKVYKALSEVYLLKGDFQSSNKYLLSYIDVLNKNNEILRKRAINDIETKAVIEKKNNIIKHKNLQLKLQSVQSLVKTKEQELKLSRQAISVHFLKRISFKLMDLIRNKSDQAYGFARESFQLIHYTMNGHIKETHSLAEEMKFIDRYAGLMKKLYNIDFTFLINTYSDEKHVLVPIFILQPVIENAIIHGLLPVKRKGKIEINFREKDGILHICVSDNGVGIKDSLKKNKLRNGHLGIHITEERLKAFAEMRERKFDKALVYTDMKSRGTKAELLIPVI